MPASHGPAGLYHLGSMLLFIFPEGIRPVREPKSGTRKNHQLGLWILFGYRCVR